MAMLITNDLSAPEDMWCVLLMTPKLTEDQVFLIVNHEML